MRCSSRISRSASPRRNRYTEFVHLTTLRQLLTHFLHRERWFLVPLLGVLLLAGALLLATSGLSMVGPLVYTLF